METPLRMITLALEGAKTEAYIITGFVLYNESRQEKENYVFELSCLLFQKDILCDIICFFLAVLS